MTLLPRCSCGKVWAPTQQQAQAMHDFIADHKGHTRNVNYYECSFGAWHWTRQQIWRDHSERV